MFATSVGLKEEIEPLADLAAFAAFLRLDMNFSLSGWLVGVSAYVSYFPAARRKSREWLIRCFYARPSSLSARPRAPALRAPVPPDRRAPKSPPVRSTPGRAHR